MRAYDAGDQRAWAYRGLIHQGLGDDAKAIADFTQALSDTATHFAGVGKLGSAIDERACAASQLVGTQSFGLRIVAVLVEALEEHPGRAGAIASG